MGTPLTRTRLAQKSLIAPSKHVHSESSLNGDFLAFASVSPSTELPTRSSLTRSMVNCSEDQEQPGIKISGTSVATSSTPSMSGVIPYWKSYRWKNSTLGLIGTPRQILPPVFGRSIRTDDSKDLVAHWRTKILWIKNQKLFIPFQKCLHLFKN